MNQMLTSIKRGANKNEIEVWLKMTQADPFPTTTSRRIGTAAFPLAFKKEGVSREMIKVVMADAFKDDYEIVVNPRAETALTARAPEYYFSINIAEFRDSPFEIKLNEEFKFFSIFIDGGIPDDAMIVNICYRFAAGGGNAQAQVAIEDNLANEYTTPFNNPEDTVPFYAIPGQSEFFTDGEDKGAGEMGFIATTANSYIKLV